MIQDDVFGFERPDHVLQVRPAAVIKWLRDQKDHATERSGHPLEFFRRDLNSVKAAALPGDRTLEGTHCGIDRRGAAGPILNKCGGVCEADHRGLAALAEQLAFNQTSRAPYGGKPCPHCIIRLDRQGKAMGWSMTSSRNFCVWSLSKT